MMMTTDRKESIPRLLLVEDNAADIMLLEEVMADIDVDVFPNVVG